MQAAHSLQQLGAEIYVPDLVMVTLPAGDGVAFGGT